MPLWDATAYIRGAIATRLARLAGRLTNGVLLVLLDYPPALADTPRYGYGRPSNTALQELIGSRMETYEQTLAMFMEFSEDLARIEVDAKDPLEPSWMNKYLPGLDTAAIYCFVRERRPELYLEIGSGNSTLVANRARRDGGLVTKIISIDPAPRVEIDRVCDELLRDSLEAADLSVFRRLRRGDVLFFDGSHRVFMNSDVTAFFLDLLPALPGGVLVGIHDIYLPDDYPPDIAWRYWSEQYLLAAYLLGNRDVEIVLPATYATRAPRLKGALDGLWSRPQLKMVERYGAAFWFTA